jgi:MFS family permease
LILNCRRLLGCIYIFVSEASPSRSALGKAYGLSQTVSAVMAAAGPAIATSLVALSLQNNLLGGAFGYICLALMGVVALALTSLLPD